MTGQGRLLSDRDELLVSTPVHRTIGTDGTIARAVQGISIEYLLGV
jgi:hypothetical protein